MTNKREIRGWAIPLLTILIIFQTIVLAGSSRFIPARRYQAERMKIQPISPVQPLKESKEYSAILAFTPSEITLKKGEMASIDLILIPKRELRLDGIDIILTFNPQLIEVSQVTTPKLFSFVSEKKEKEKEGKIYLTFLEEKQSGLLIKEDIKLFTLNIKGKERGTTVLSILTSNEGPTTVITESGTSRRISFEKVNLPVIVH